MQKNKEEKLPYKCSVGTGICIHDCGCQRKKDNEERKRREEE
jgi:hypothetical protein